MSGSRSSTGQVSRLEHNQRLPDLTVLIALTVLTSLAAGIWRSALNARYRDIGYIIPFLLQVGFFVSPVVYETKALIPEGWRMLFALNPMVGVLEGFRWALLGTDTAPGFMIIVSFFVAVLLLVSGLYYFRRMERKFADVI